MKKLKCENCNDIFEADRKRKFCNIKCRKKFYYKEKTNRPSNTIYITTYDNDALEFKTSSNNFTIYINTEQVWPKKY